MERERKRKVEKIPEPTPSSESLGTDDTPPPRTQIRKRLTVDSILMKYDEKMMSFQTSLIELEDSIKRIGGIITRLDQRMDDLTADILDTKGIRRSLVDACTADTKDTRNSCTDIIKSVRDKAQEARDLLEALEEPYCARCNEFGHHDC